MSVRKSLGQIRRFHNNESGDSGALTNVMLLAVAALVVIALLVFGKEAMGFLRESWQKIRGESI